MALGRPLPPLVLSDEEVQQLQSIANSRSYPHSLVQRAQIVLACGAGETNTAIANRMGLTGMTVGKWRKRYRDLGLEGLHDELRSGRPRTYEDDQVAEVINRARHQTRRWQHPLERPLTGPRHRHLQKHGAPLAADLLGAAAPAEAFQAVDGSVLCRESPRHRRSIPQSARERCCALR